MSTIYFPIVIFGARIRPHSRILAHNIFYPGPEPVKAMKAFGGCDISRIRVRHSPFWADGI
jgi:hypothetical protein